MGGNKRDSKSNTADWRSLPTEKWTVRTFSVMCIDRNREMFGVESYVPFRNWKAENALIKRNLTQYGAEVLREVFEESFRDYKPTREYPQLTAGFVLSYVASRILPRILAEREARERRTLAELDGPGAAEVAAWL